MGTRELMYACGCMGRVSATCLGPVARWVFGLHVWGSCRLCESEGAQGTRVVTVGAGLSIDKNMGTCFFSVLWWRFEYEKWSLWLSVKAPGKEVSS